MFADRMARKRSPAIALGLLATAALWLGCAERDESLTGPGSEQPALGVSTPPGQDNAQDAFDAAITAQERHTPRLMRMEGVVGTAVGLNPAGRPVVRIFTARPGVGNIPEHLDNVPVSVEVTGMFVADADPTSRARPAPVGYSVGHPDITAGTIGARVIDASGNHYILSNNHVLANSNGASLGDAILQPGPFDGGTNPADRIGTLADYEVIDFSLSGYNTMDAAIAAVSDADVGFATPADGYGTPNAQAYTLDANNDGNADPSLLGLQVQKYGRTTQLTTGVVTEINLFVEVCYEVFFGFCITSAYMYDQLGFSDISEGGDSGSLIVTNNADNKPVALLFAGSATRTIGNRIDLVLQRFGVTVDDGSGGGDPGGGDPGGGENQPPTASFSYQCTDLSCDFDASASSDDGTIVSYDWDFGDGSNGSGVTASHTYAAGATYTVALTVTDDGGLSDTDQQAVPVSEPSSEPTLVGTGTKVRGRHVIDLTWSNIPWSSIYVFRDGVVVDVLPGSETGAYSDATGQKGKATYTHFICEGTDLLSQCSNPVITSY
jgi:PKD repeat protein